jgi:hypothetical protein
MQPVPDVSSEDIGRLIARDYAAAVDDVTQRLDGLDHRLQAAVLKLGGGDQAELARYASWADDDYRDVLAMAEYPEYLARVTPDTAPFERQEVIERDWAQYQEWFEG